MFNALTVLLVDLSYILALFCIALRAEKRAGLSRKLSDNPWIYSLSLAVYCTSWTFYGSVGKAVTSGMLFLTIYLGPTLAIVLWWIVLRKMVRIKDRYRITSIADFISARYDKSQPIAILVTVAALVGSMPYIALQIKAVNAAFRTISLDQGVVSAWVLENIGLITIVLFIGFTIVFGVRRLDPTERHPGMITAVAVESLVKLLAFLACGLFVTYVLYDGFGDVFGYLATPNGPGVDAEALRGLTSLSGDAEQPYVIWATYLVLAMSAIMFLPRQFHVAVVENSREEHILTAMWVFPLYMLLINVFVLPIAIAGLHGGIPAQYADTYMLRVPMLHDQPWLTLLVFLGGFSAAMSMVMISSMTLATMLTNHILLPLVQVVRPLGFLRRHLLRCRWAAVVFVLGMGCLFEITVGESYMLVNMGMISFAAVLQFAPALLGGLFWRGANRMGALFGLGAGVVVWAYTLLLPAFVRSSWLPLSLLDGPFGWSVLAPEALFGLVGLDDLTHTVFWSLFFNIGFYVLGSLLFTQKESEQAIADEFVSAMMPRARLRDEDAGAATIPIKERLERIEQSLNMFFSLRQARVMLEDCVRRAGLEGRDKISHIELAEIRKEVEKTLAGAVGAAAASHALSTADIFTETEAARLSEHYLRILADLKLSPADLKERVDYHQEREKLLAQQAAQLERTVELRTRDLAQKAHELEEANKRLLELDRMKSQFLSSVSHELRTPLTSVLGFAKLIHRDMCKVFLPLVRDDESLFRRAERIRENIGIIAEEGQRLTRLINDVLDMNKIEEGRMEWHDRDISLYKLAEQAVNGVSGLFASKHGVRLGLELDEGLPRVHADPDRLLQVLFNLLNNAHKFTPQGEVLLAVRRAPDGGVLLSVRDTGVGIPSNEHDKIFDSFYQVVRGDTLHAKPRGTGLGLVICKQIVTHYGGRILVESKEGRGSTFTVELPPRLTVPAAKGDSDRSQLLQPDSEGGNGGVLVVDDDPAICKYLCQILEDEGYETIAALDGESALDMARRRKPDLITMDLMMPGLDGRAAMAALREDPVLGTVPVVVVSVLPERSEAGGSESFGKPVDEERFLDAVRMLLDKDRKACANSMLVRGDDREEPKLYLCQGALDAVTLRHLEERLQQGFQGTVLVPPEVLDEFDLVRLSRYAGVQLVLLGQGE